MSTVFTEYGIGRIVGSETTRGRTSYKVAGAGFEVWIDEKKIRTAAGESSGLPAGAADTASPSPGGLSAPTNTNATMDSTNAGAVSTPTSVSDVSAQLAPNPDITALTAARYAGEVYEMHVRDPHINPDGHHPLGPGYDRPGFGPEDIDEYENYLDRHDYRHAFAPVDHDNSTTLPYDPTPQYPAIPSDDESTIQPIHEIDPEQRLDASDSITFEDRSDDDEPGPNPELFADGGGHSDWTRESSRHEAIAPALLIPLAEMAGSALSDLTKSKGGDGGQQGGSEGGNSESGDEGGGLHLPDVMSPWQAHLENPEVGGQRQAFYRPAGLSDRYIEIEADANTEYHRNPVAQFRHDPQAYINRIGHLHSADLHDSRMGDYMNLVEADHHIREAAWKDVRQKALRLRREGRVHVEDISPDRIYATVEGDHGTYTTMISKRNSFAGLPGGQSIGSWHCSCLWGVWAFKRQSNFVGRLCSHGLAAYHEMQSAHLKGNPRLRRQIQPPRRRKRADVLQGEPQRLVPELVVNDTDDAHLMLDLQKDEREDTGPADVVSEKDIVHFARRRWAAEDPTMDPDFEDEPGTYTKMRSIDDEGGKKYRRVPPEIAQALRHRFDGGSASVYHPDKPGVILHDIENFWDGPTEVKDLGNGDLEYTNPWNKRTDRFRAEGYYDETGQVKPWSREARRRIAEDQDEQDWDVTDAGKARADLNRLRNWAEESQEDYAGGMADHVDDVRQVVQNARDKGVDADVLVAMRLGWLRTADGGTYDPAIGRDRDSSGNVVTGPSFSLGVPGSNKVYDPKTQRDIPRTQEAPASSQPEQGGTSLFPSQDSKVNSGGGSGTPLFPSQDSKVNSGGGANGNGGSSSGGGNIGGGANGTNTGNGGSGSNAGGGGGASSGANGINTTNTDGGGGSDWSARDIGNNSISGDTYTVQQGDTLSNIAQGWGMGDNWQGLYDSNKDAIGPDANLIHPGDVLTKPGGGTSGAPAGGVDIGSSGSTGSAGGGDLVPGLQAPAAPEPPTPAGAEAITPASNPAGPLNANPTLDNPPAPSGDASGTPAKESRRLTPDQLVAQRLGWFRTADEVVAARLGWTRIADDNDYQNNDTSALPKPGESAYSPEQKAQSDAANNDTGALTDNPNSNPLVGTPNLSGFDLGPVSNAIGDNAEKAVNNIGQGFATAQDAMGSAATVGQSIGDIASTVGGAVGQFLPGIGGAISGIGEGIGGMMGAFGNLGSGHLGARDYPEPQDHKPFAGSGAYEDDLDFGTSADYVDKNERPDFEDVTDLFEGSDGNYGKGLEKYRIPDDERVAAARFYAQDDAASAPAEDSGGGDVAATDAAATEAAPTATTSVDPARDAAMDWIGGNGYVPSLEQLADEKSNYESDAARPSSTKGPRERELIQRGAARDRDYDPLARVSAHDYEDPGMTDIVAAFQRNAANSALASDGGGGGRFDDLAGAAQGFLRTAGRNYSVAEQLALVNERHPLGARNLDSLNLEGTHYEAENSIGLW